MTLPANLTILTLVFALVVLLFAFVQLRRNKADLARRKKELEQRMYETMILREIGERIGYELNIGKIMDTIVASLNKLLSFSVVSYMLISPDGSSVTYKIHTEVPVGRKFLDQMRDHMLPILSEHGPRQFAVSDLVEGFSGTPFETEKDQAIGSLWMTPLLINSRGIGVLAVASLDYGLYKGSEMEILTQILSQANRAVNNLEALIASEQKKLGAMVGSMADGVLMIDKDMNLVAINRAAVKILGLPEGSKLTIIDVTRSLSDRLDLRAKVDQCQESMQVVNFDNLELRSQVFQLLISPVKNELGKFSGTVVLFHEVTATKQLSKLREEFTAMMVHELRAPLTVVRGTTDMFIRNPQLASESQGQELLKTMQNSATSMLTLVNDLLDVAKLESGKFQILKTKGNISEMIDDRVIFFKQIASAKNVQLESQIPDRNLVFDFDRERISQVFNNLISNAIKFTSPGGKIVVSAYRVNSANDIHFRFEPLPDIKIEVPSVVVSVFDTGSGISADGMKELFSKFKQLHPIHQDNPAHVGTGLGLVIAKGIVESHGGQLFVESRVDEGTTFSFILPAS